MRLQLTPQAAGARILGLGSMQPDRVVTNHDLEKIVETNDEWIRSRVGIVERRFGDEDDSVVSMGVEAGSKAPMTAPWTSSVP